MQKLDIFQLKNYACTKLKWAIKLNAFALNYIPLSDVKWKALADFLAQHLV